MKKVVKILYVVNGCNLDWPTYAATLRLRQNFPFLMAKNKSVRVTIAEADISICGPNYVILFVLLRSIQPLFENFSGNSYFPAAKSHVIMGQNH